MAKRTSGTRGSSSERPITTRAKNAPAKGKKTGTGAEGNAPPSPSGKTASAGNHPTILFTGFPGFIGRRLIRRLFELDPGMRLIVLVQEKFVDSARVSIDEIAATRPNAAVNTTFAVGDITRGNLGLDDDTLRRVKGEVTQVWHLAAVYDLAIDAAQAHRINVEGTRNVLDLCERMGALDRLVYFSTCYVSGSRTGRVRESELELGQSFKNNYEATKFKAEVLVHQRRNTVPSVVIRPSIVIGDSRTGETDKFDGPYPVFRLLSRMEAKGWLRKGMRLPTLGSGDALINLVPVDYLVAAACAIGLGKKSVGETYQICDPEPLRTWELYAAVYRAFGLGDPWGAIPNTVLKAASKVPILSDVLGIDRQAVDYIDHFVVYDDEHTRAALAGTGILCPRINDYLPTILAFVRKHRGAVGGAKF